MSIFLPAHRDFQQSPAQNLARVAIGCSAVVGGGMVTVMAEALSRLSAWFSQTVTLPLLPGLLPPEADRFFSYALPGTGVERVFPMRGGAATTTN